MYIYIWSKGDDVILINSHMTNEEYYTSNFKFKTPISKLQIQDFKKNFEKKKIKKNSKCHISTFSAPETKSRILKSIIFQNHVKKV